MAKKVFKLKEIAQEGDYVHPVVSSGTGPDFTSDNGWFQRISSLMTTRK